MNSDIEVMNKQVMFLWFATLLFSSCEDFFVKDISKKQVDLIAPKSEGVVESRDVTLVWQPLDGAEEYHVVLVSPSFSDIRSYVCDSVTQDYKIKVHVQSGSYQWSVQAVNSAYVSLKSYDTFQVDLP